MTPPAIESRSPFLKKFPLNTWGTITALESKGKYASIQVIAKDTIVQMHPRIAREVLARKYTIIGADNEGFESEIYFALKGKFYGAFQLREGPCDGLITIRLLYLRRPGAEGEIPSLTSSPTPAPQG